MLKFRQQNYKAANLDFDKSISIKADYPEAYFYRGDSKMEMKDFEGALADLDKAIALKPEFPRAFYTKGLARFLMKDYKNAIPEFSHALAFSTFEDASGCYYFRGLSEVQTDQKDSGCRDLKKAAEGGFKNAADAITKYCQ